MKNNYVNGGRGGDSAEFTGREREESRSRRADELVRGNVAPVCVPSDSEKSEKFFGHFLRISWGKGFRENAPFSGASSADPRCFASIPRAQPH